MNTILSKIRNIILLTVISTAVAQCATIHLTTTVEVELMQAEETYDLAGTTFKQERKTYRQAGATYRQERKTYRQERKTYRQERKTYRQARETIIQEMETYDLAEETIMQGRETYRLAKVTYNLAEDTFKQTGVTYRQAEETYDLAEKTLVICILNDITNQAAQEKYGKPNSQEQQKYNMPGIANIIKTYLYPLQS